MRRRRPGQVVRENYEIFSEFKRIMTERIYYYQDLAKLKWDVWFYFTAVEYIILAAVLIPLMITVVVFATMEISTFNNPFTDIEMTYNIISSVVLAILIILNISFIFRKKNVEENEEKKLIYKENYNDEIQQLRHIIVISILLLILLVIVFLLINNNIMSNISLFTQANLDRTNEFTGLIMDYTNVYKMSVTLRQITPIILSVIIVCLEFVWASRLNKKQTNTVKTDVLLDEEENVKY